MARTLQRFLRRRALLVGFLAVVAPLGVLLGLQYKWLVNLQKTSAIAEKAWLNNYLEAVSSEVEYFYRTEAERALNIPTYLVTHKRFDKIDAYVRKKSVKGAKYLFVVRYVNKEEWGEFFGYDTRTEAVGPPTDFRTYQAIGVALSPWKTLAYKGGPVPSHEPVVDELDPHNRVILNPITDDACQLMGIAGMIVDTDYFQGTVLPAAIEKSLPNFFDERAQDNLVITVRDRMDRLVWGAETDGDDTEQVTTSIPFIFSDWTLALGSRYATPEQWAKSNFLLNMSLSLLLMLALLGGVVLALRTASNEMRLSKMKSDFVSNVSHELRTPLASIRVFGEFLRLGRVEDEGKIREYGEYIETESRRLTQLINNILDFSKIESEAKSYVFEKADVGGVVAETIRTLEVALKHKGTRLSFRPSPEPLPEVRIDPNAIAQALANLVDNAAKYTDGTGEIEVTLEATDESVIIAVADHGIGISADEQKKIFERFHRVGTELVHDVKGSGLGLAIVSHVIQAHGGRVTVDSEPGRGSTFRIHLPRGAEGETRAVPSAHPAVDSAR